MGAGQGLATAGECRLQAAHALSTLQWHCQLSILFRFGFYAGQFTREGAALGEHSLAGCHSAGSVEGLPQECVRLGATASKCMSAPAGQNLSVLSRCIDNIRCCPRYVVLLYLQGACATIANHDYSCSRMGVIIISFSSSTLILPRTCMHQWLARMPLCPIPAAVQDQAKHISIAHHACSCQCSQFLLANLLLIRNLMADSCANLFGASVFISQLLFVTISAEASKARPSPVSTWMPSCSLRFAISGPVPDHC